MKVYTDITQLPIFTNAVITIGTFDGVHSGHSEIIAQMIKEAEAVNGTPVVITFYPHPKQVVSTTQKPLYTLNTPQEKYRLLHSKGIEEVVVIPFDKIFSAQPAADYIKNFLVDKFHPHTIIIGYDHRFGKDREGDYQLLEKEATLYGFSVKEIPQHVLLNATISSTKIREALLSGDIATAASFLGYDYFFSGEVMEGNKLGRTIGFPTANILIEDENKLVPANGVYAVEIYIEGKPFKGMMNIGIRPTVDGTKRVIEVNIFDFNNTIYGQQVTVILKKWLRNEVKFNGLDALKAQLAKDRIQALAAL